MPLTRTEKFVFDLSRQSFLSLWSHPNPKGKKGKELCDILVCCGPHIIIMSVKEILPTESGDFNTDFKRWKKTALDKSYRQIYGAERFLNTTNTLKLVDGSSELTLPPIKERVFYRVAVVIGGEKKMPLFWGDMGKGFIHVFDSISAKTLISELDTITDFTKYLKKKEEFYEGGNFEKIDILGGEEDLLALYLNNSENFTSGGYDKTILEEGIWESHMGSESDKKWKQEVKESFLWDSIIELLSKDFKKGNMDTHTGFNDFELVMRTMAMESRSERIYLSKKFLEFYSNPKTRSRLAESNSGIVYVFLECGNEDRKYRRAELLGRCLIVRKYTPKSKIIVGIATEKQGDNSGFSIDVTYLDKPKLSKKDEEDVEQMINEFGWFKSSFGNKKNDDN